MRLFGRSFLEPFRSPLQWIALAVIPLLAWILMFVAFSTSAERASQVPWILTGLVRTQGLVLMLPGLVLGLPLISAGLRNRSILYELMQPISRPAYYAAQVTGRCAFAFVYTAALVGSLVLEVSLLNSSFFSEWQNPFPPDVSATLVLGGLSTVTIVAALAALAPLASSRFGHLIYWAGLVFMVVQARDLNEHVGAPPLVSKAFSWIALEVMQPMILGVSPALADTAGLGSWFLMRAVSQWAFGLSLVFLLGLLAFSRMEVARR